MNDNTATAQVINHIFNRFRGAIPSLKYSADSEVALNLIRREYAIALIRHNITDVEVIEAAINLAVDRNYRFLPSPGEFVSLCKEVMRKVRIDDSDAKRLLESKTKEIDNELESRAIDILRRGGITLPRMSDYGLNSLEAWAKDMQRLRQAVQSVKEDLISQKSIETDQ